MKKRSKFTNVMLYSGIVVLSFLILIVIVKNVVSNKKQPLESTVEESVKPQYVVQLPVANIMQKPELPTGCEITSLAILLRYYGYDADKEELAKNYLKMAPVGELSYYDAFAGDPWDEDGWGCYATVIYDAASKFLEDNKSNLKVYNLSGNEFEDILAQIAQGCPVLVWTNIHPDDKPEAREETLNDGAKVTWITPEHCVVLKGYDLENRLVTICDPLGYYETINLDVFAQSYEDHMRQAVTIK